MVETQFEWRLAPDKIDVNPASSELAQLVYRKRETSHPQSDQSRLPEDRDRRGISYGKDSSSFASPNLNRVYWHRGEGMKKGL